MSNDFIAGCVIASIIVFLFVGLYLTEEFNEVLENKSYKLHCATEEMEEKIRKLADENRYFLKHLDKYTVDDFHFSESFDVIFMDFENDIEDIGW